MLSVDILDLIPQSLKQQVRDTLVDFLAEQAEKFDRDDIATKFKTLRSDTIFNRAFEEGLERAARRFVDEYEAEDEDLVAAIGADKSLFKNEEIQAALMAILKKPGIYLAEEREKVARSFPSLLPYQLIDQLNSLLPTLPRQYHRLILVVGRHGVGKTHLLKEFSRRADGAVPYLNLNLALSQRLLDLTSKERPLRVRRLLAEILDEHPEETLALDNIELLFEPRLHQDPLVLLQGLSRNKSLVAAWPATYDEASQVLTYAEPGHPEYRRYQRPEAIVVSCE